MSTGCTVEKSIISVACIRTVKINSKNTNYIAHHIVGVSKAKNQICKHSHNVCARFSLAKCFSYKFFFRVSVALEIRMLTHSNCVGKFSSHVRFYLACLRRNTCQLQLPSQRMVLLLLSLSTPPTLSLPLLSSRWRVLAVQ